MHTILILDVDNDFVLDKKIQGYHIEFIRQIDI